MQRAALLAFMLSSLLTTACVTRAHHDASLRELVATGAEASEAKQRLAKLQSQSEREDARISSLEALVAERQAELVEPDEQKAALGRELAASQLERLESEVAR